MPKKSRAGRRHSSCPATPRAVRDVSLRTPVTVRFGRRSTIADDSDLILDVLDARDLLGAVLRDPLLLPILDRARQRHLATLHRHFDVRRIDLTVIGQRLADHLADSLVGALKPQRALPAIRTFVMHLVMTMSRQPR